MRQKSNFFQPKLTLAEFGIKLVLSQGSQHKPQMFYMLFLGLGIDQDVVDEHHYKLVEELHEHLIHEIHEVGRGIGQAERHYGVFKQTVASGEGGLGNTGLTDFQLMISSVEINLGEHFGPIQLIK
jgi:hypothetical protein